MITVFRGFVAFGLGFLGISVGFAALPPAPPVETVPLAEADARELATVLFGCSVTAVREGPHAYSVALGSCAACPLEKVRGTRCGRFSWTPDRARFYRTSFVAAVSGHLARNRVVVVELTSHGAGVSYSRMHGVLVFERSEPDPRSRPAFAWYLTRLGRTIAVDFADVDQDGAMDVLYTYAVREAGGGRVIARDVWSVHDGAAERTIASGDSLPGPAGAVFDGFYLHRDREDLMERGTWRTIPLAGAHSPLIVLERAAVGMLAHPVWQFLVVADLGDGLSEFLSGAPPAPPGQEVFLDGSEAGTCEPAEVPAGLSLETREVLLRLESACRSARDASAVRPEPAIVAAMRLLWAASAARAGGLKAVSLSLECAAGNALMQSGRSGFWLALPLWAHATWTAHRMLAQAYDERFSALPSSPWTGGRLAAPIRGLFKALARLFGGAGDPRGGVQSVSPSVPVVDENSARITLSK